MPSLDVKDSSLSEVRECGGTEVHPPLGLRCAGAQDSLLAPGLASSLSHNHDETSSKPLITSSHPFTERIDEHAEVSNGPEHKNTSLHAPTSLEPVIPTDSAQPLSPIIVHFIESAFPSLLKIELPSECHPSHLSNPPSPPPLDPSLLSRFQASSPDSALPSSPESSALAHSSILSIPKTFQTPERHTNQTQACTENETENNDLERDQSLENENLENNKSLEMDKSLKDDVILKNDDSLDINESIGNDDSLNIDESLENDTSQENNESMSVSLSYSASPSESSDVVSSPSTSFLASPSSSSYTSSLSASIPAALARRQTLSLFSLNAQVLQ